MTAPAPSRLSRLLAMVPYFLAHPGTSADEAAADLGVTPKEVMADLNQLWMCGLPGYTPGDLIDLDFSEESIQVTFSAGIDRPLRLTPTEASVLLVALRALIDMRGVLDPEAARRAIAKVERAVGSARDPGDPDVRTGAGEPSDAAETTDVSAPMAAVRDAVRGSRAVWIRYYSASRDAVSERIVDPVRIVAVDGNSYLEGWCRQSAGIRLFRLDRVDEARVLDEPATVPDEPDPEATLALFNADPQLPTALITIDPSVVWVMDYYLIEPLDDVAETAPGTHIRAQMTYGSEDWLTRFVLGFGGRIRLMNAPGAAGEVTRRAADALAAYDGPTR
ncbi:protein pafC [Williamsia sp. Leaf354]|uniref:helix-turn-helix transcriptional regulator n=1 Tax=Williamsia sp. Leaf354 TaxID=1736349 RepID=UPI0006FD0D17|nr:YafY family protein [Williamsia sp. Leaf354]KQR98582.1 protein pafC [Williamsia sp. Leaf354]